MIINANMSDLRGKKYSGNLNKNKYSSKNSNETPTLGQSSKQISFGMIDPSPFIEIFKNVLEYAAARGVIDMAMKGLKKVGNYIGHLFGYKTKLAEKAEKAREAIGNKVIENIGGRVGQIIKKNPQTPPDQIIDIYGSKLERVIIPLKGDGYEQGLNKIIGNAELKTGFYNDVLMPLCEVIEGKNKHSFVKTGINFFGPKGTGKTYFAEQLGDHYVRKGGFFEKIKFTNDLAQDTAILEKAYTNAEKRFIESGKKKYTMIFIDEVEKYLGKDNSLQGRTAKLLELANNGKDKGAILVTTANYLDRVEPALLRNGRTDLRVPIGHIADFDLADMINYYIKKDGLPAEENINFQQVIDAVKTEKLQYKPKDIEDRLAGAAADYADYGRKLDTEALKEALIKIKPEFNNSENAQFLKDRSYANQQDIGGIYEC